MLRIAAFSAALMICGSLVAQATSAPAGPSCMIEGVDRYRVVEPMFEAMRVVLAHRGADHSPAYIQGLGGTAFTIAGICPCGPTCAKVPRSPEDLLKYLGYEVTPVKFIANAPDADAQYAAFLKSVKDELRAGRPVLVWNAMTNYEWDVVCGFDDAAGTFAGRGSYGSEETYATAPQARPRSGADVTDTLALIIGKKTRTFDAHAAEIEALQFAVKHARSKGREYEKWTLLEGIECYERWVRDVAKPDFKKATGDSYCLGILRSTRRAAADFMEEMAVKHPDAAEPLKQAAVHFRAEADALESLMPTLWWQGPNDADAARNAGSAKALANALAEYSAAIAHIETALTTLK